MLRSLVLALTALLLVAAGASAAGTASVDGGTLRFAGTPASDNHRFSVDGASVHLIGVTAGSGCVAANRSGDIRCDGVQRIEADLGDGDDDFNLAAAGRTLENPTMPVSVRGGAGDDTLIGGDGNDTLDGGPGKDLMNAHGGDDTILAADGADDQGADCGEGRDQATSDELRGYAIQEQPSDCERVERHVARGQPPRVYLYLTDTAAVTNDITITQDATSFTLRDAAGLADYPGCQRLDAQAVRCAQVFRFDFDLGGGDDRIVWRGGAQTITYGFGGDGNDVMHLGPGKDFVYGGNGDDTLDGGAGFDTLKDDQGADTIIGGAGFDIMEGGDGADRFDMRDGGAMALRKGAAAEAWEGSFDEPTDCEPADKLLADPLDASTRCERAIAFADTDARLPASALPKIKRVSGPDIHSSDIRVALSCAKACRGGVGYFAGAMRGAYKPFDLKPGGRTVVSLSSLLPDKARGAKRVVVQASDGAGRTRSVARKLPTTRY